MLDLSEVRLIVINCIIFVLSIFFSCLYYFYPYLKNKSEQDIKSYYQDNKIRLICSICFFVLFITRLFLIDKFPGGYNQDEASSAYDAYSIMMTGKDRAGNFLPVHCCLG